MEPNGDELLVFVVDVQTIEMLRRKMSFIAFSGKCIAIISTISSTGMAVIS